MVVRSVGERGAQPTAAVLDGRTLQPAPEGGGRAGYDGAEKKNGSRVRIAVDALGHPLALKVTAASEQERAQVGELTARLQEVTGGAVEVASVDQGYTGEAAADQAAGNGTRREVVKHTEAKTGPCCCPGGGSWSGASPGSDGSGGWPATPSG